MLAIREGNETIENDEGPEFPSETIRLSVCAVDAEEHGDGYNVILVPLQTLNSFLSFATELQKKMDLEKPISAIYNHHGFKIERHKIGGLIRDGDVIYVSTEEVDGDDVIVHVQGGCERSSSRARSQVSRRWTIGKKEASRSSAFMRPPRRSAAAKGQDLQRRKDLVHAALKPLITTLMAVSVPCRSKQPGDTIMRRIVYPLLVFVFLVGYWVLHIVSRTVIILAENQSKDNLSFVIGWLALHMLIAYIHGYLCLRFRVDTLVNEIICVDFTGCEGEAERFEALVSHLGRDVKRKMVLAGVVAFLMWASMLQGEVQLLITDGVNGLSQDYILSYDLPLPMLIIRLITLPVSLLLLTTTMVLFHVWLRVHEAALEALGERLVQRELPGCSCLTEHQRIRITIKHTCRFFQNILLGAILVLSVFNFESIYLLVNYFQGTWLAVPLGFYLFITLACFGTVSFVITRSAQLTSKCKKFVDIANNMVPRASEILEHMLLVQHLNVSNAGFQIFGVQLSNPGLIQFLYWLCYGIFFALGRLVTPENFDGPD